MFSNEEKEEIRKAASAVWDECAYDVLQAVAEEKNKHVDEVTIPRSHVVEIALDAGRAEERLRMKMKKLVRVQILIFYL